MSRIMIGMLSSAVFVMAVSLDMRQIAGFVFGILLFVIFLGEEEW